MAFNTIKFVKGDSYRELWISDDFYRIATPTSPYGGKRHYDDVTKYISDMLSQGWKKANTATYLRTKYRR